jgi:hypothetical protein
MIFIGKPRVRWKNNRILGKRTEKYKGASLERKVLSKVVKVKV